MQLTRPERPKPFVLDTLAWPLQIAHRATPRTRPRASEVEPTLGSAELFSPEFVALVEEILGEEPERADRPQ